MQTVPHQWRGTSPALLGPIGTQIIPGDHGQTATRTHGIRASQSQSGIRPSHPPASPRLRFLQTFRLMRKFLDNCEKYGYKLHRKVQPTNWSRKRQLAGRPVEDISIVDITKNGWEEHALRVLSQGSFVTPVWARSTSEAVFAAGLFKKMNMPSTS